MAESTGYCGFYIDEIILYYKKNKREGTLGYKKTKEKVLWESKMAPELV